MDISGSQKSPPYLLETVIQVAKGANLMSISCFASDILL